MLRKFPFFETSIFPHDFEKCELKFAESAFNLLRIWVATRNAAYYSTKIESKKAKSTNARKLCNHRENLVFIALFFALTFHACFGLIIHPWLCRNLFFNTISCVPFYLGHWNWPFRKDTAQLILIAWLLRVIATEIWSDLLKQPQTLQKSEFRAEYEEKNFLKDVRSCINWIENS